MTKYCSDHTWTWTTTDDYRWVAGADGCVAEPRLHMVRDSWAASWYIIQSHSESEWELMLRTLHWRVRSTVEWMLFKDRPVPQPLRQFVRDAQPSQPKQPNDNAKRRRPLPKYEVAERDNWVCHLCGGDIDRRRHEQGNLNYWGASADHVVPLSKGGTHDLSNLKAAHLICNIRRGAKDLEAVG